MNRPASQLSLNQWSLGGEWGIDGESTQLDQAPGSIAYRFEGRDANLVMTPPVTGEAVHFTVRLDGQPPGADRGLDVDESGGGMLSEPRMHQLVRQAEPGRQRTVEVTFDAAGVSAFVFTFG